MGVSRAKGRVFCDEIIARLVHFLHADVTLPAFEYHALPCKCLVFRTMLVTFGTSHLA